MGFGFWTASYLSRRILWRGRIFEMLPGGKMRAANRGEEMSWPPEGDR